MQIFIQIIGFIAAATAIASFQSNKHKNIMILKTISETLFSIQFIMLGAYTGVVMNVVGSVRNIIFARLVLKKKSTLPYIIIFSVIVVVSGALTWEGAVSLLAIAGKLATTWAYGMHDASKVRLFTVPSCLCWAVYDALSFSFAGIATEIFSLTSIVVAEIRLRRGMRVKHLESHGDQHKSKVSV